VALRSTSLQDASSILQTNEIREGDSSSVNLAAVVPQNSPSVVLSSSISDATSTTTPAPLPLSSTNSEISSHLTSRKRLFKNKKSIEKFQKSLLPVERNGIVRQLPDFMARIESNLTSFRNDSIIPHVPAVVDSKGMDRMKELRKEAGQMPVVKDEDLEAAVDKLNEKLRQERSYEVVVVTEWGLLNGHRLPQRLKKGKGHDPDMLKIEKQCFLEMKVRCLDKGLPFQHVLIRVEGDGTCFTYSSLEAVLLMQHFQQKISRGGGMVPDAKAVKKAVLAKLSTSAMEVTRSGLLFIDEFKNHHVVMPGGLMYASAYPGDFAELDEVSKQEILHDFKFECFTGQKVSSFNSELVSTMMAMEMGVTNNQFGNQMGSWQEYNKSTQPPLMETYQCNMNSHYWGLIDANEIKQTQVYSDAQLAQLKRVEDFVFKKHTETVPSMKKLGRQEPRKLLTLAQNMAWVDSLKMDANRAMRNWRRHLLLTAMLPIFPGMVNTALNLQHESTCPSKDECAQASVEAVRLGLFSGTEMNSVLVNVDKFWDNKKMSMDELGKLNQLCMKK
jgi:hypothetical protein